MYHKGVKQMAIKSEYPAVVPARSNTVDEVISAIHKSASMMTEAATTACDARDPHLVWMLMNSERTMRRMASNLSRNFKS
jgi:hypothetical protein